MILEVFKTHIGKVFISILWGLALSLFLKKTCTGNKCIVVQGPPIAEISSGIYKFGNTGSESCYKFQPVLKQCDEASKQTVCV